MRAAEGLVRVEVHQVGAEIAGPGDAQDGVHVGPVEIDQPAGVVDHPGDLPASARSNRPSVLGLVIMNTATSSLSLRGQVVEVDEALAACS